MMLSAKRRWQPRLGLAPRILRSRRALLGLACVTACAVLGVPRGEAVAGTLCKEFTLDCRFGQEVAGYGDRALKGDAGLRRRVLNAKNACSVVRLSENPFGCDWRATVRAMGGGGGGGGTGGRGIYDAQPASVGGGGVGFAAGAPPAGGAAQPAPIQAAPPGPTAAPGPWSPPPRRDPAGRLGTTPAPLGPSAGQGNAPTQPPSGGRAPDRGPHQEAIEAAASRYQIPADLVRAVIQVESGWNPQAQSVAGAVGLMQLLPETGRAMGAEDLRDAAQNIAAGTRFLRLLANRFDGDLVKVLSAYHAGGTRVLRREATPFAATDSYVRKVLGVYYALRDG